MKFEIIIKRNPSDDCPYPLNQALIFKWLAWVIRKCPYACEVKVS